MIKNYFFIPANKPKFIQKSETIQGIDNRIFDFEDSILNKDINYSINLLRQVKQRDTDWVRVPLEDNIFEEILESTLNTGYKNFVIPKFKGSNEFTLYANKILNLNKNAKFILLIEHPKALVEAEDILKKYSKCIHGIGLGSQDMSIEVGMINDIDIFRSIRINIMILAKAYNIEAIDVVSMNISNKESFENEIADGFKCGYRSKFLIHPFQLQVIKNFRFYTDEEVDMYQEILKYYESNIERHNALFSYKGKAYEKMHIKQFKKIVEWRENFYGTDR